MRKGSSPACIGPSLVYLVKLTCIGDERVARDHGAFARDGDASTVKFGKILLDVITMDIDRSFCVSNAGLGFNMISSTGGLHVFRIALEEHSKRMSHAAMEGGRLRFDEKRV